LTFSVKNKDIQCQEIVICFITKFVVLAGAVIGLTDHQKRGDHRNHTRDKVRDGKRNPDKLYRLDEC
jgi:hypothetical protein